MLQRQIGTFIISGGLMFNLLINDRFFLVACSAGLMFWVGYAILTPNNLVHVSSIGFQKVLLLTLLYPVLEEAAFRGWLQSHLLRWKVGSKTWVGISIANAITSMAFVAVHFFYHYWAWAIAVIFPSLIFGFFRERYNSILPGCMLHIWYNSGYYVVLALSVNAEYLLEL